MYSSSSSSSSSTIQHPTAPCDKYVHRIYLILTHLKSRSRPTPPVVRPSLFSCAGSSSSSSSSSNGGGGGGGETMIDMTFLMATII